jgi:hypothetical protein
MMWLAVGLAFVAAFRYHMIPLRFLEVGLLYLIFTTSGVRSSHQHDEPIEGRSWRDVLPAGR